MNNPVHLYPQPRSFQWLEGERSLPADFKLELHGAEAEQAAAQLGIAFHLKKAVSRQDSSGLPQTAVNVKVSYRAGLHAQGYVLEWSDSGLLFEFGGTAGLYYAMTTFKQLVAREGTVWNYFRIEDGPDYPVRGLLLDIGRNKIPKSATLYSLIDRMAELKLNHLELYMEGYPYEYEKYKSVFPETTPITADEFRQLDAYATSRFIDLVPNQNCLGHMGIWLNKPEFREYAEHPDGQPTSLDYTFPPLTLNPVDTRSIELIKDLFDELLPQFSSDFVNINMDEPFGLGTGKSKARTDEIGVGGLYMEYAEKVFEIVRSHGKKPLMWGDVLTKHPEVIHFLPKDVTILDWNYDGDVSFEKHCKLLHGNGIPFYVCPGTSTWLAISGRTDNMLLNLADAAVQGRKYGAGGMLLTDWGDAGHWQVLSASYPGIIYAAGLSWQVEANLNNLAEVEAYATEQVFQDRSGTIGNLLVELGRYHLLERSTIENGTYTSHLLHRGLQTREQLESEANMIKKIQVEFGGRGGPFEIDYQYDSMMEWLQDRKTQLNRLELDISDGEIVRDELANTIRLIEQGIGLHRYIYRIDVPDRETERALLTELAAGLHTAIEEFNRLWLIRNREGGLASSNQAMYRLLEQYGAQLDELEAGQ